MRCEKPTFRPSQNKIIYPSPSIARGSDFPKGLLLARGAGTRRVNNHSFSTFQVLKSKSQNTRNHEYQSPLSWVTVKAVTVITLPFVEIPCHPDRSDSLRKESSNWQPKIQLLGRNLLKWRRLLSTVQRLPHPKERSKQTRGTSRFFLSCSHLGVCTLASGAALLFLIPSRQLITAQTLPHKEPSNHKFEYLPAASLITKCAAKLYRKRNMPNLPGVLACPGTAAG